VTSDKVDLGPARDSLTVEDPAAAANRVIPEMKKKGATVIVLLSELGKVESEDLVTSVDGVDAVICGRNVPVRQKGRMIKNTIACYGGEQGQNLGRTIVTLDASKKMQTGENDVFVLGPEVGEKPDILALVKQFNDDFNEKLKQHQPPPPPPPVANVPGQPVDHFVGAQVCQRCHVAEYSQWLTTDHAKAWQTLVDAKREATPECVTCHVVGYQKAGGFHTADDATALGNVQCESCHGMGTQHVAFPAGGQGRGAAAARR